MRILITLGLCIAAATAMAQTERAAFTQSGHGASLTFATDYQCVGINPANLGWKSRYPAKKVTFGLGELGYSLTTSAFDREGVKNDLIKSITGDPEAFDFPGKVEAAKLFTQAPLAFNVDLMLFGIAYQDSSAGGFAFVARDRAQWYTEFNKTVSEIMFQGFFAPYFDFLVGDFDHDDINDTIPNDDNVTEHQREEVVQGINSDPLTASKLLSGSAYEMLWYREYGLSYGRMISDGAMVDFYGGLGVKYLVGIGMLDISSEGGEFIARSALSPGFEIDYGEDAKKNPSTVEGDGFKKVGSGFAVDLGVNVVINDKVKIGVSYVDLGTIKWDGNVYVAADSTVQFLEENGFDTYNFFDEADNFTSDKGLYEWDGVTEVKVKLPSTLRTGVGYVVSEKVEVGVEGVIPMNEEPGAYRSAVIALGVDYRPVPFLSLNTGMTTGGLYPMRVPLGLVVGPKSGTWEGGFATRDILSLFGGDEPTLSMCFGILRFRV